MTPLVAGIALTGKAPVYENVYMSGLKQKAAGEAAKAKELSETEKQIRASLKITSGTYHPTFHERVKDLTSTALAKSLEAMEKDPIRGINAALQIVNDATNVLGVYSENSKKLFEIEKPQYQKDFYAPSSFISAIGQKSFDEVMADQNLAQELEKYKIIVENRSGVPVLTVPAFARRNPAKELIEYQKSVVGQFPVEEGEITSLGGVRQQKLRQSMPDAQLEEMIIGMRQDPTDVAAWFYNHDVDITTDDGVKEAVKIAKYVEDKGIISRPGMTINLGDGSKTTTSPVVSQASLTADTSYNWSPSARPEGHYVLQFAEGFGDKNLVASDVKGNPLKFKSQKEAEEYLVNNSKFDYEAIKTLNLDIPPVGITIPAGEKSFTIGEEGSRTGYGEKVESNTFNMKVNRLETTETYTGDKTLTVGLFRMEKGDIIPPKISKYVPSDKTEKRVFVVGEVQTSYNTNVGARDKGGTVYVPATKQNISAIISKLTPSDTETRKMLEDINTGRQKLGDGRIIGAATKGAERQPKSGFSLLEFDNIA